MNNQALERMNGLVSTENMMLLEVPSISLTLELLKEGFEVEDVLDFFNHHLKITANKVHEEMLLQKVKVLEWFVIAKSNGRPLAVVQAVSPFEAEQIFINSDDSYTPEDMAYLVTKPWSVPVLVKSP
jgi:uncharacterized protein YktA (UPF0223 family)